MARISTGQTYGTTTRQTSPRLLGAEEVQSLSGALDVRPINAPAISPQANPVNTFVQAGAPTLGGPVGVPRPPDIPASNGDLARLAQALGNFSPVLQQVGEGYVNFKKQQEVAAKQRGEQLAAQLATRGFRNIGEAIREIERSSVADPSLLPLLTELRAKDDRAKFYAQDRLDELALQQSMAMAPEIVKNTSRLPDGRDMRMVSPDDSAFFGLIMSSAVPAGTSPGVLARNSTALMQTYANIRNEQTKRVADTNDELFRGGFTNGVTGSVQQLAGGSIDDAQLVLLLGDGLDLLYSNSRPSLYAEVAKKLPDALVAAVQSIEDPEKRLRVAGIIADKVLRNIPTGPPRPDGTRLRLIDTLEGETTVREFFRKATSNVLEDRELDQKVRSARAEDVADAAVLQMFTPEVMNDPGRLNQAIKDIPRLAETYFNNDVVAQNAFRDRATKAANGRRGAYIEDLQEKTAAELLHQQAMNPNANLMGLLPQYKQLYDNGQLSLSQYNQLASNARSAAREDTQGAMAQVRKNVAAYERRLKELAMGPGGTLTYEKEAEINEKAAQFYQQQLDYVKGNPGRDVTRDLAGQFTGAIGPMIEAEKEEARKPLNQSPAEVINRYNLKSNRGKPEDNNKLLQDAQNRVLLPPDITRQQLRGLLGGDSGAMDAQTKRMLLRLKQMGMPASTYYIQQLKNMGDTVSPAMERKLRELDQSDLLSSAQPISAPAIASTLGRYSSMSNNLISMLGQGALNVIAPPAQAATSRPTATMAAIRPFEKPASVVYESASGQPGVDYWFPSKQFPAVLSGVVKDVRREGGYGNFVVIESVDPRNGQKVDVLYGHLANGGVNVRPGQTVQAGQIIGQQGGTGRVRSADGTIASVDFLAPAPAGSGSMTPYRDYDGLRRWVTRQLQRGGR